MPKVASVGPYSAKFWLRPVRLAHNHGFSRNELARIQRIITAHESICAEKWNDYFA